MAKYKYIYNPETVSYDKIEITYKDYLKKIGRHLLTTGLLSLFIIIVLSYFFDSPKEKRQARELKFVKDKYGVLLKRLSEVEAVAKDIQDRDDNIYRVIFERDPIPTNIRRAGFGGVNRYKEFEGYDNSELVKNASEKLDVLKKALYIQTKSFDEIAKLVENREETFRCIPALMPLKITDFRRISSGFGYRIHPIFKTKIFHKGMDFSGKVGTPIYATGDGVVLKVKYDRAAGNMIVIDHGYNYKTAYKHLSGFNVKIGQKVKRGHVIGYLGNTGNSTGPHLHYELYYKNTPKNPVHYYFNDLSAKQYEEIVKIAENAGQSMEK